MPIVVSNCELSQAIRKRFDQAFVFGRNQEIITPSDSVLLQTLPSFIDRVIWMPRCF